MSFSRVARYLNHNTTRKSAAILGIVSCSTLYLRSKFQTYKSTYIVPVGALLNMDYQLTVKEFSKLASAQGKKLNLNPATIEAILLLDDRFKQGLDDEKTFRDGVTALLGITVSEKEFNAAWNAMLGNTEHLAERLQVISQQKVNVAFLSNTNPIHARHLGIDQRDDIFFSYKNHTTPEQSYQQVHAQHPSQQVTLLSRVHTQIGGLTTKRDADFAKAMLEWTQKEKISVCSVQPNENVVTAMQTCIANQNTQKAVEDFRHLRIK